jgi:hypothetical protein
VTKSMNMQTGNFDKCPLAPFPQYDPTRKRWRLVARTFTRRSDKKAKRVLVGQFDTEEAAQQDVQCWWDVLRGVAGSPPIKPVTLNCSEENRRKKLAVIARQGRVTISRKEFKELYAHYDESALARWVRHMQRRRDDLSQSNAKWLLSMSGRRERLEGMLIEIRDILRCFREVQMSGTVIKYILTEEEDELVDHSARQVGRIHQQVMFSTWSSRKKNNGTGNKRANLQDRVARSLDIGSILPLERIWKFERRTRDYKNVYIKLGEGNIDADDVDHKFIEKMVKNHKTHRNIVEIDRSFLHDNR